MIINETLSPKVSAIPLPNGSIVSMPLEDMSPLLEIEELQKKVAQRLGYKLVDHKLELYGTKIKKN